MQLNEANQQRFEAAKANDFDVTDAYFAEAKPLWEKLFEISKRHGVPASFVACTAKETTLSEDGSGFATRRHLAGMRHFNGPERTPDEFAVISTLIDQGLDEGAKVLSILQLSRAMNGHASTSCEVLERVTPQ